MAYQARRRKRFTETFELLNEEDEVVQTLFVDLDADSIVAKLNRKYTDLTGRWRIRQRQKEMLRTTRKSQLLLKH